MVSKISQEKEGKYYVVYYHLHVESKKQKKPISYKQIPQLVSSSSLGLCFTQLFSKEFKKYQME